MRLVRCDTEVRRHTLRLECVDLAPLSFDELRIKQVVINLVRNAAQSMVDPGEITLRAGPCPEDPAFVCLEVSDQGSGVAPEVLVNIWKPFFSTRGAAGMGLGLDICRSIVEQHGGSVACQSARGVGSTFTVRLPVAGSVASPP